MWSFFLYSLVYNQFFVADILSSDQRLSPTPHLASGDKRRISEVPYSYLISVCYLLPLYHESFFSVIFVCQDVCLFFQYIPVSKTYSHQFYTIVLGTTHPRMFLFAPIYMQHQQLEIISFLLAGNIKNCISVYSYFNQMLYRGSRPSFARLKRSKAFLDRRLLTCFQLKFVISLILNTQSFPVFLSPFFALFPKVLSKGFTRLPVWSSHEKHVEQIVLKLNLLIGIRHWRISFFLEVISGSSAKLLCQNSMIDSIW